LIGEQGGEFDLSLRTHRLLRERLRLKAVVVWGIFRGWFGIRGGRLSVGFWLIWFGHIPTPILYLSKALRALFVFRTTKALFLPAAPP